MQWSNNISGHFQTISQNQTRIYFHVKQNSREKMHNQIESNRTEQGKRQKPTAFNNLVVFGLFILLFYLSFFVVYLWKLIWTATNRLNRCILYILELTFFLCVFFTTTGHVTNNNNFVCLFLYTFFISFLNLCIKIIKNVVSLAF